MHLTFFLFPVLGDRMLGGHTAKLKGSCAWNYSHVPDCTKPCACQTGACFPPPMSPAWIGATAEVCTGLCGGHTCLPWELSFAEGQRPCLTCFSLGDLICCLPCYTLDIPLPTLSWAHGGYQDEPRAQSGHQVRLGGLDGDSGFAKIGHSLFKTAYFY